LLDSLLQEIKMNISCPTFGSCHDTLSDDGGYNSNDTSCEEERRSFCFVNFQSEVSCQLIASTGPSVTFSERFVGALNPSPDCVIASLSKPVHDLAFFSETLFIALTQDGLFGVSMRTVSPDDKGVLLIGGSYSGLAVLAPDSDCPLILTTSTSGEASFLEVIDISGDIHCQKIPISSIPSDVLPFSQISSISVDLSNNVFLTDCGLQRVIQMNLETYSCYQFCYFSQDYQVLASLAMPGRLYIVVSSDEETTLRTWDTQTRTEVSQEVLAGEKFHKIDVFEGCPAVLLDNKIEFVRM